MLPALAFQGQSRAQAESPRAAASREAPAAGSQEAPAAGSQEKSDPRQGRVETDPAKLAAPRTPAEVNVPLASAPVDTRTFIIGAEDVLTIRVWREPELSGQFMVRPDGRISLPLVNEVQAAGQTPEQLTGAIIQGLSKYMNHPQVTVAVAQVNSRKYYIQGEVTRPGAYPLVVPTTVLEALVNAGGFREFANTKKIIILRKGKERLQFNYKEVTKGKRTEQNILLQPGDQIIVN
jgi:polysaccharide export outer membrane protein